MFDKKFFTAAFTLSGTIIGAGILGLPYVFSKSGFFIGVFWLVFLGLLMLLINLCLGEISLRTKGINQLPGYAEKYLGKKWKNFMLVVVAFGIYSALVAYLIGQGQSLSMLFFHTTEYSVYFALGFWAFMTLLLREGLRGLKRFGLYGVSGVIVIVVLIFLMFLPSANFDNLIYIEKGNFFVPFGVVLFSLLGFTAVPELERIQNGKKLKYAIILGSLLPVFLYIIFTFASLGILGKNVEQVATLSLGRIVILLGIFTMSTAYFVLSFALKDAFVLDFKTKKPVFFWVSVFPLFLYLIVSFFNLADFAKILGIGGVISGGLTGILIMLIHMKAKKKGNRKPEFSVPMNWFIFGILSLVFLAGILFELL